LQNLARKYKEENDQLRGENAALQRKVAQLEAEKLAAVTTLYQPRKRVSVDDTVPVQPTKRTKTVAGSLSALISAPISYPSSPSSTSSVESYPSPTFDVNPVPYRIAQPEISLFPDYPTESNSLVSTSVADDTDPPFQRFDCGFCDEHTPCVCREILEQHVADRIGRLGQLTLKIDHSEAPGILSSSTSQAQTSILDNLPAYQPAVPLRRRAFNKQAGGGSSIFPIVQPSSLPSTCSGDPRNCRACASDDFGKAFCDAMNNSMTASGATGTMDVSDETPPKSPVEAGTEKQTMVPCDDAWRQLKSHPNVEFSDLNLLAEVVARRSKCTGPRVVISPPLGSVTPERGGTPFFPPSGSSRLPEFSGDISNTRGGTAAGEYNRIGVREVPREALQAALNLLDAKAGMSLS
jgi:AP-1-like transcription factor